MAKATSQYEETLRKGAFKNGKQDEVKLCSPGRVQQSRQAGPHGKQTDLKRKSDPVRSRFSDSAT